jgi:isopentenyl diphosphate isomerase/L-lactate dehydrogenase-like FMN-dependent dehydrogenase
VLIYPTGEWRRSLSYEFVTNEEIVRAARRRLAQGPWDYLVGATESETTMRRNRLAFDRLAFRPRVLVDVSSIDKSTTFLGHHLRIPVILAPIGGLQNFDSEGGVSVAKAAHEFGILQVVSSATLQLWKRSLLPLQAPRYISSTFAATGSGPRA